MIYADHAATTKTSAAAKAAMIACMDESWGNPSSLYTLGQEANEVLQDARGRVARCIGAEEREIYFTSGGSEADNQAIRSAAYWGARKGQKAPGVHGHRAPCGAAYAGAAERGRF